MNAADRKKWLRELCKVRNVTPDTDPWEASAVSFLMSEIAIRDALLYRIRMTPGNGPISAMIREELGEE